MDWWTVLAYSLILCGVAALCSASFAGSMAIMYWLLPPREHGSLFKTRHIDERKK